MEFLSVEQVLALHAHAIERHGGAGGVRDLALLEAAVAMPRQQAQGRYLHDGPAAMAAAYHFHLAKNHPFHDGNKRVAALAALVFLDANGIRSLPPARALERVTWQVADGTLSKQELTQWMQSHVAE